MHNIYMLSDAAIYERIGRRIKQSRLKQNITQQSLSEYAEISISSLKKIERGEIGTFDSLLRVLRTLGLLDALQPLVEDEQLSPSEYYDFVHSSKSKKRERASGKLEHKEKEAAEWLT